MIVDLTTTNVLLGVMAAVSLLEALAIIGLFLGAFLIYRRMVKVIGGIEERQVAPIAARVNAILDDIQSVTSSVKEEAGRVESIVSRLMSTIGAWRRRREPSEHSPDLY